MKDIKHRAFEDSPMGHLESPLYFTLYEDKFQRISPNNYVQKTGKGEVEITKQSNDLMDALIGGDVISEQEYLTN